MIMAVAVAACGGSSSETTTPITPPAVLTSISVSLSTASLQVGQSATASAAGLDQNGSAIAVGAVTWTSSNLAVASVTSDGTIAALSAGQATITATAGGKTAQAIVTVTAAPVATVVVTPATASIAVSATQQLTAGVFDANGTALAGRAVAWSSADLTKAVVSTTGLVTGVGAGTAIITATSEGKSGSATVTVTAPVSQGNCTSASSVQLTLGEVRTLTAAQAGALCIGGLKGSSEYVLIPFNNSKVASLTTPLVLTATNTGTVTTSPSVAPSQPAAQLRSSHAASEAMELAFRTREARDISNLQSRARVPTRGLHLSALGQITGVTGIPSVGTIVQLNSNLSENSCSSAKVLHPARVVAVFPHAIVFVDTLSPLGGYTDSELAGFGASFDTEGFALDTLNFGAPSDIDENGRVAIFFTPGVNLIPGPPGGTVLGLFAGRDLIAASLMGCVGSNEGEMFYLPVPDPNKTLNANYTNKADLSSAVLATLVHEFQHLINAGRRYYVNHVAVDEEVWLNEGLSHIAEELLYYKESGKTPGQNLDLQAAAATGPLTDAFNAYQSQNFGRLYSYLIAPSANSPYSSVDGLEMRGAIWELLRYSADRKGGTDRSIWYPLVNSTTSGQANFNAVFGDIVTNTRDWAVAQFIDDDGFAVAAKYTNPSWNFRSIFPALTKAQNFPLAVSALIGGAPLSLSIVGGGAAYVRFSIGNGLLAGIVATSSGVAVPSNIDFILVRTQ
jgi:hypothetical protein